MARVSVCLTHYNRPAKLAATLESLAAQTRQPDEVFLWDDRSPDDPTKVAQQFAARFRHFVYHRNERNLNMPGNLNAVIAQATGDYVANLHDADTFAPTLLEKWEAALDRAPSAGLVFCGVDGRQGGSGNGKVWLHDIAALTAGRKFFEEQFVGRVGSPIWGTVMARRTVYERLLPFDAAFRNWADVDMWMRICHIADIAYVREPLIVLDHTETPLRRFSWYRVLISHAMALSNIDRTPGEVDARRREMRNRQLRRLRTQFVRLMIAALPRRDWKRWNRGRRIARAVWRGELLPPMLEDLWTAEVGGN